MNINIKVTFESLRMSAVYAARKRGLTAVPVLHGKAAVVTITICRPASLRLLPFLMALSDFASHRLWLQVLGWLTCGATNYAVTFLTCTDTSTSL